jgi:thiol-disulfide isomerase/thioredoxin
VPGKKLRKKEQKQARKTRNKRALYLSVLAGVVVVVIILASVWSSLFPPAKSLAAYIDTPISSSLYSSLQQIAGTPTSYTNSSYAKDIVFYNHTPWFVGGKPLVVFIGAEYCPYCASLRWSLILSLMKFGSFTGLEYMLSSSSDIAMNTPTFTFVNATYTSPYVALQTFENKNRDYQLLQTVPSNYTNVWDGFASSIGSQPGYPFVIFADEYLLPTFFITPYRYDAYNWTQIVAQIQDNTTLGVMIQAGANQITSVLCKLDNNKPASVCSTSAIQSLEAGLPGGHSGSAESLATGKTNTSAQMWVAVQYTQIAWIRNISEKIR